MNTTLDEKILDAPNVGYCSDSDEETGEATSTTCNNTASSCGGPIPSPGRANTGPKGVLSDYELFVLTEREKDRMKEANVRQKGLVRTVMSWRAGSRDGNMHDAWGYALQFGPGPRLLMRSLPHVRHMRCCMVVHVVLDIDACGAACCDWGPPMPTWSGLRMPLRSRTTLHAARDHAF